MFSRLRELLVQEVPEELSVCTFECPVTHCTYSMWSACTLRLRKLPARSVAVHFDARMVRAEEPVSAEILDNQPSYT